MRQWCLFSTAVLVCLLFAQPNGAFAADGAIPIWAPTTITEPGNYVLTRDIELPGVPTVIAIAASYVDLDLNGFRVYSSNTGIIAQDVNHVTIRNG